MKNLFFFVLLLFSCVFLTTPVTSQSLVSSKDFTLASPFSEPDGRSDVVRIDNSNFVTLSKSKGNQTGKSEFYLERFDEQLNVSWRKSISAENSEDYKDLYYNGKELVLLSVVHIETEKKTKMIGYGFDVKNGNQLWVKELESYQVGDWENHPHKGRVKETFIDIVCEHVNQDFVTPFEYKHNIHFSPDQSKFISYVYNYGESNLTASICLYDNSCNLLKKGKIAIDNDYVNYGLFIDNEAKVYILNAGITSGKTNFIQLDLDTKDFNILELPFSNYLKDDFHASIYENGIIYLGNSEVKDGRIYGAMLSKFNFNTKEVEFSNFVAFDSEFKSKIASDRKSNKTMKGDEDWMDFDLTHFEFKSNSEVLMAFEKRALHGDGYPHIGKDAFDKSHKNEINGHVQAETVILLAFNNDGELKWKNYHLKNQVYPATDGLNTISYILGSKNDEINMLYASSENLDGSLHTINIVTINYNNGSIVKRKTLPNPDKLTLVKDYTLFMEDQSILLVGKKGLLGKSSMIVKYTY